MNEDLAEIGKQVEEAQARIDAAREAARLERVAEKDAARLERARQLLADINAEAPEASPRRYTPRPEPETSAVDSDDADES